MVFDLKRCHTIYLTKGMIETYGMCHFVYHTCSCVLDPYGCYEKSAI